MFNNGALKENKKFFFHGLLKHDCFNACCACLLIIVWSSLETRMIKVATRGEALAKVSLSREKWSEDEKKVLSEPLRWYEGVTEQNKLLNTSFKQT